MSHNLHYTSNPFSRHSYTCAPSNTNITKKHRHIHDLPCAAALTISGFPARGDKPYKAGWPNAAGGIMTGT